MIMNALIKAANVDLHVFVINYKTYLRISSLIKLSLMRSQKLTSSSPHIKANFFTNCMKEAIKISLKGNFPLVVSSE